MKLLFAAALVCLLTIAMGSCKSSAKGAAQLCDTTCIKDTIRFNGNHPLQPFVAISAKNCKGDTIIWGYNFIGNRKTGFDYPEVRLNKDFVRCIFKDTGYVYLLFNDCSTRRGYQVKLPFSRDKNFSIRTSGINNLDPKFSVDDKLVAYTDRGNIYVENVSTGNDAMMTFREKLDIDYDAIHEFIDTVNISPTRIWVKVKLKEGWKEIEKSVKLD